MFDEILSFFDAGLLYFVLIMIAAAVVVVLGRKILLKLLHPVKREKVQVAGAERQDQNINAAARKMSSMSSGKFSMNTSNMAHAMVDNMLYTFYRLEHNNQKLKLKIPVNQGSNMAQVGDIGYVEYQNGTILSFEKIGTVQQEDEKKVQFQL